MKIGDSSINLQLDAEIEGSFSVDLYQEHQFEELQFCRSNYHRIFLIAKAQGILHIDDQAYALADGGLFLLAKGQLYAFEKGAVLSGYELIFGDCFWEKTPASASNCKAVLFNNAAANQHLVPDKAGIQELTGLFETLHKEYLSDDYINKPDALAAYLKILMIKIANLNAVLSEGYDNHDRQLYRDFLELVAAHYREIHEVGRYAELLGIPGRKLTELCKSCSGQGAKEIINGQLIAEAKRSLQFSSRPVKDIAYELNFSTPEQFSHFFKKYAEHAPNDYRKRFVDFGM